MVPLLSDDLVLGLDRVRFAEELGISPDPWQQDLLRSTAKRVLLTFRYFPNSFSRDCLETRLATRRRG
jgi:hypothetical protein